MPMPRKLSAASPVMYAGTASENETRIGAQMFGSSCRKRMCPSPAPAARAASTNSRSRSETTWPRTSRAVPVQPKAAKTTISTPTANQAGMASRGP